MQKKITLVGSTGSIGRQLIEIVKHHRDKFNIVSMTANQNYQRFIEQVEEMQPKIAALRADITVAKSAKIAIGEEAFIQACQFAESDIVFVAATGFAGLKATLLAIEAGKDVALANKESLVVAGNLVMQRARKKNVQIIPVDSEHSAIWQALNFERKNFHKLILTASGGALRDIPLEKLKYIKAKEALAHPNWKMGDKITIDCATMLNKGYEVIEAMHFFSAKLSQVEIICHRESIVHSMVEFLDGSILAQMGMPSMEIPLQLALTYPARLQCAVQPIAWDKIKTLHFEEVEERRYPCLTLALEAARRGGIYPLVLNAWAEIAVNAFLKDKIAYTSIASIIEKGLSSVKENIQIDEYLQLEEIDCMERQKAQLFMKM